MSLQYLCFIYKFVEDPSQPGFRIIGVHDHLKPWSAMQLAANGLITQKFSSRSNMEQSVEALAKRLNASTFCLLSIQEYNVLLEDSHQVDDFRKRLQSKERSLFLSKEKKSETTDEKLVNNQNTTIKAQGGFLSRFFNQDNS